MNFLAIVSFYFIFGIYNQTFLMFSLCFQEVIINKIEFPITYLILESAANKSFNYLINFHSFIVITVNK